MMSPARPIDGTRRLVLLGFASSLAFSCTPVTEPMWGEDGGQPQWTSEAPPIDAGTTAAPVAPPSVVSPVSAVEGTGWQVAMVEESAEISRVTRTYSLKERFLSGQRLRRRLRVERSFQLSLESSLPAEAQGSTETTREYLVRVDEASGGQIQRANIDVLTDTRRLLPVGDVRPRLPVTAGALQGVSMGCQITDSGRYQCETPETLGPLRDLGGITPQRIGMWPGKMVSMGEPWELRGREAESFLDMEGAAEVVVRFVLEDPEAAFRDDECRRVVYSIDGTQRIPFSGTIQTATITGRGEFYYCQDQSTVIFHTQERTTSVQTTIRQGPEPLVLVRDVSVVMEEETSVER